MEVQNTIEEQQNKMKKDKFENFQIHMQKMKKDFNLLLQSLTISDSFNQELPRSNQIQTTSQTFIINCQGILNIIDSIKQDIILNENFQNQVRQEYEDLLDKQIEGTQKQLNQK